MEDVGVDFGCSRKTDAKKKKIFRLDVVASPLLRDFLSIFSAFYWNSKLIFFIGRTRVYYNVRSGNISTRE